MVKIIIFAISDMAVSVVSIKIIMKRSPDCRITGYIINGEIIYRQLRGMVHVFKYRKWRWSFIITHLIYREEGYYDARKTKGALI
jgi:hypothetical protein